MNTPTQCGRSDRCTKPNGHPGWCNAQRGGYSFDADDEAEEELEAEEEPVLGRLTRQRTGGSLEAAVPAAQARWNASLDFEAEQRAARRREKARVSGGVSEEEPAASGNLAPAAEASVGDDEGDGKCLICKESIDSLDLVTLDCDHAFCKGCMKTLISTPATCVSQQPHNRGDSFKAAWTSRCPKCRRPFNSREMRASCGIGTRAAAAAPANAAAAEEAPAEAAAESLCCCKSGERGC